MNSIHRWLEGEEPGLAPVLLAGLLAPITLVLLLNACTPGVLDRSAKVKGRDFLQFYVSGRLIGEGRQRHLYDHQAFQDVQRSLTPIDALNPEYFPLYPPTVGLVIAPLSFLPYPWAVAIWWGIQGTGYWWAARILFRERPIAAKWKATVGLLFALFAPVFFTILNGQLSFVWLLALAHVGRCLTRRAPFCAGVWLSVLALKPSLALGAGAWIALRWLAGLGSRMGWGFFAGVVGQVLAVCAVLDRSVWLAFKDNIGVYSKLAQIYQFSPDYEQSIAGIARKLLQRINGNWDFLGEWMGLLLGLVVCVRVFQTLRRRGTAQNTTIVKDCAWRECSLGAGLTLLLPPHLLVYDYSLMLVPFVVGWTHGGSARRWAFWVYLAVELSPLAKIVGFSWAPLALLVWMLADFGLPPAEKEDRALPTKKEGA